MTKGIIIAVIVLIVLAGLFFEWRRSSDLGSVAKRLGFSYQGGQQALPTDLDAVGFDLFSQGAPQVNNRFSGVRNGNRFSLFDFSYEAIASGEGSRDLPVQDDQVNLENRSQTVVWVEHSLSLPDFDISPSGGHMRSVAQRAGLSRVSIDGQPLFNRQYHLLARDPAAVRALFNQGLIDTLLAQPPLVIESRGRHLLFYRFGERVKPGAIAGHLVQIDRLLEALASVPE